MNSQVKLVSCMSLEDKAKEYADKNFRLVGDAWECDDTREELSESYISGYKQALADMIEEAPKFKSIFFDSDNTKQCMKVISLINLEKIAEDLKK